MGIDKCVRVGFTPSSCPLTPGSRPAILAFCVILILSLKEKAICRSVKRVKREHWTIENPRFHGQSGFDSWLPPW